ncbi:maltokinase N-terminal cap-like domain-containing protein [Streptomyces sp. HB2AG]|uniref:maltokinase N-terminal cap-like domain-containing protein n=1 Tax=Streptomyces sp. HB2AG TaxID=2983400 RepID=UPI0022AB3A3A|nr:1,4-alpha-glucan branching protein [Streptomyces sp. HB2AG]MCZ2524104.1 1,4-alpha-glucan branching protein [Streptomyces sp. HB2AG]
MSVIHRTTMKPTKLELLAPWLPGRPWYLGAGGEPRLTRAGGFRLDDPQGEVGIEFMVAVDEAGDRPVAYQVPLTYRGAPLDGAEHALVGTSEHGVLGRRWIYDGVHDPVLLARLFALLDGEAEPQQQSISNTPDPTVTARFTGAGPLSPAEVTDVTDGPHGTDVHARDAATGPGRLTLRVNRVLEPLRDEPSAPAGQAPGDVTAGWLMPDGTAARALFAVVHAAG